MASSYNWLWQALYNINADIVLSKLVPEDWDWNQVHATYGTPLMAMINEGIRLSTNSCDNAPVWRLVRSCMARGADPRKEVQNISGSCCGWGDANGIFPKLEHIKSSGHSALSLVFAIRAACHKHEKEYKVQIATANKMLNVFTEFVPQHDAPRVSLLEAVVETWETMLADERTTDVELKVAGGTVRAHGAVLRAASRVLDAALSSPMCEGATGSIKVEGASMDSVKLLLQLIYTGSTSIELSTPVLLGTLDLSHRWQIHHVVSMVERTLIGMIQPDSLGELCEAAVLKELPALRAACRSFVSSNNEAKAVLEKGNLPPRATEELKAALCGSLRSPEAKRPRRSL